MAGYWLSSTIWLLTQPITWAPQALQVVPLAQLRQIVCRGLRNQFHHFLPPHRATAMKLNNYISWCVVLLFGCKKEIEKYKTIGFIATFQILVKRIWLYEPLGVSQFEATWPTSMTKQNGHTYALPSSSSWSLSPSWPSSWSAHLATLMHLLPSLVATTKDKKSPESWSRPQARSQQGCVTRPIHKHKCLTFIIIATILWAFS